MTDRAKLAVLGAGSWGSTLAALLHANGHEVRVWCHSGEELEQLRETGHPPGVPELKLPALTLTTEIAEAARGCDAAVLVIPAQAATALCKRLREEEIAIPLMVIASKGIDLTTLRPLSAVIEEALPDTRVGVISGPCIAREVAQGIPTSVVAACSDADSAGAIQRWFAGPAFRVYRQADVLGVEYAGAYKNVIAIAAGVGDGLGYGANSKSALLTRGLAEMRRFAVELGAQESTISGLAGIGDLCVTCFSPHSRNRRFGEALGKGGKPAEALGGIGETVEGAPTARAVCRIAAERGLSVPLAEAVVRIMDGEWNPREAVIRLMSRELKEEN